MLLQQAEWAEWLQHPVTKEFRALLLRRIESLKDEWMAGALISETELGTKVLNNRALGACQMLKDLHELDHEQVNREMSDD